ncbi:VOC family protein, partial [Streptomyces sp. NPDC001215]
MTTATQPPFAYSLHNVTITVSDLDASIQWWNRVFGLTLLATPLATPSPTHCRRLCRTLPPRRPGARSVVRR